MISVRKPWRDKGVWGARKAIGGLRVGEWERNTVRSLGRRAPWRTFGGSALQLHTEPYSKSGQ